MISLLKEVRNRATTSLAGYLLVSSRVIGDNAHHSNHGYPSPQLINLLVDMDVDAYQV